MRNRKPVGLAYITTLAILAAPCLPAMAAEETISAFSVWVGEGQVIKTAPSQATFIGTLDGLVYVNTEEGPVETGRMLCPATVRIDMTSGQQTGSGNCSITSPDGAQVFSELTCSGVHLVGCSGEMKLTGGTGRFEKITGGGTFTIRSSLQTLGLSPTTSIEHAARGIIYWPQLKYVLP